MPGQLEYVADGDWMAVRRNADTTGRLLSPVVPQARVYNSANISVATGSTVALTFNSERFDNGDLHSTSSDQSRLTAPVTGLYLIDGGVVWAGNATGLRFVSIRANGTTVIKTDERGNNGAGDTVIMGVTTLWRLAAGEYVELTVFQNSGGALNVLADTARSPEFSMVRMSGYVNQGV